MNITAGAFGTGLSFYISHGDREQYLTDYLYGVH